MARDLDRFRRRAFFLFYEEDSRADGDESDGQEESQFGIKNWVITIEDGGFADAAQGECQAGSDE